MLETVTFRSGLKIIPPLLFSRCENLNCVNLPDTLEEIGSEAFINCENLISLQIPLSVSSIDPDAFTECRHLMLFVYPDSYARDYAKDRNILFSEV